MAWRMAALRASAGLRSLAAMGGLTGLLLLSMAEYATEPGVITQAHWPGMLRLWAACWMLAFAATVVLMVPSRFDVVRGVTGLFSARRA